MFHSGRSTGALLALFSFLLAPPASADDKQQCAAAYKSAQDLKDTSSLLAARQQLRTCAQKCSDWMVKDCTEWLDKVEKQIPTVVFVAKSPTGAFVSDVVVREGDKTLASQLDGSPLAIDPGKHVFTFRGADGSEASVTTVVIAGKASQPIEVVLGKPSEAQPTKKDEAAPEPKSDPKPEGGKVDKPTDAAAGGWHRPVGLGALGAGVIGLGLGTYFAVHGTSRYHDTCNYNGVADKCQDDADVAARESAIHQKTGGFVLIGIGAGLSALGVVLLVSGPPGSEARTSIVLTPRTVSIAGRF